MKISEMIYVLDKEKDCIQKRQYGNCTHNCENCEAHLEAGTILDAFERIVNLIFTIDKHSTKKDY
jgi:hypothetical protein